MTNIQTPDVTLCHKAFLTASRVVQYVPPWRKFLSANSVSIQSVLHLFFFSLLQERGGGKRKV
uniref:Uncharacterized protein n=1 Tax=Astyanax mexicanus TaxID=7994 RepID=A0A8B9JBA0_ASTMX